MGVVRIPGPHIVGDCVLGDCRYTDRALLALDLEDKMSKDNNGGGIGIITSFGVVFVVLKLCHVINWSWWWVTAPFWGGAAILAAIVLAVFLIYNIFD